MRIEKTSISRLNDTDFNNLKFEDKIMKYLSIKIKKLPKEDSEILKEKK